MSQQPEQSGGSTAKWLAIMVVMIAVIIIGIWIYKWITWIIYGFIALLIVIPLFLNRKWVSKIIAWIRGTYKKHMALGIITTLGALAAFLPFSAFLVGKTIWEYFIVKKKKNGIVQMQEPAELNNETNDELLSKAEDLLTKNIDSKFPPTEQ
jgi:predicted membrane protein